MAEEHRCQAPEGHRLCVNNCGFIGSPATLNLCSKCYRDLRLKEQKQASLKSPVESPLSSPSPSSSSSSSPSPSVAQPSPTIGSISPPKISAVSEKSINEEEQLAAKATVKPPSPQQQQHHHHHQPNRCSVCRKRVGLTGFKCRCGTTFCGTHRYPESHGCTFDFKTVGREEIAKANPVVKAAKLEKI